MKKEELFLRKDEEIMLKMRSLFEQHGYRKFKMSKFEEYDFYAENRSFLNSKSILTFTGSNGKLLALKPDITLSIVKTTKADRETSDRVYYTENVYRSRKESGEFKEIMQAGIEYIGEIDDSAQMEVLLLAQKCLEATEEEYLITLSHMGFIKGLMEEYHLDERQQKRILTLLSNRNSHGLRSLCMEAGLKEEEIQNLETMLGIYGTISEVLPQIRTLSCNERTKQAIVELEKIEKFVTAFGKQNYFYIDFSIVNDMDYYNGIVFQGFLKKISNVILSGGRYDNIVHKFGKDADAIGFAFAIDQLQKLEENEKEFDVDVLLVYDENVDTVALMQAAEVFRNNGQTVLTVSHERRPIRYRQLIHMKEGGLEIVTE